MKTRIIKSLLTLVMVVMALPMQSQDFMNVYLSDGDHKKIYLKDIVEISTSNHDKDGLAHYDVLYQHVITKHNRYVYNLSLVDSILFTKYDEELADQNINNAMPVLADIMANSSSIDDVKNKIDLIKGAEGVETAWINDNNLIVKIKGWESITFLFNNEVENQESVSRTKEKLDSVMKTRSAIQSGEKLKAVIANQRYSPLYNLFSSFGVLEENIRRCNIDVKYEKIPTIDFFNKDIYNYDLILLCTHGGYDGKHWLLTGTELGESFFEPNNPKLKWKAELQEILDSDTYKEKELVYGEHITINCTQKIPGGNWHAYITISEDFIRDKTEGKFNNPNSVLFAAACNTLSRNYSLADCYLGKGLGMYLGYDGPTSNSQRASVNFFESLLSGKSVYKSYEDIPKLCLENYTITFNTDLLFYSKKSTNTCKKLFLFDTMTYQTKQEEAMKQYEDNHSVIIRGSATSLDPSLITMGFEYGTDKYLSSAIKLDCDNYGYMSYNAKSFEQTLNNLKPDNTYYYRAYTFDGENYNYGHTYSFTIEKRDPLELSKTSLSMEVGETKTVDITSGCGPYTIENNSNKSAVKASINGKKVIIEAISDGVAILTIKDTKTSQTKKIEVTVTPKYADLQLSTTKLSLVEGSSGTINITAGSGEYGVTNLNSDIAKGTLNGTTITIQALAVGDAKVVVSDVKTGQKKIIEVTVTKKVADLQLSTTKLSLVEGNSGTVSITAGSGEYGVTNLNSDIAKATLNGTTITIQALAVGDAKVVVTDVKTGQKKIIEVTVTKKTGTSDIALSTQEVYLNVGETKQIEVTAGSGHYSVWIYAPEVADVTVNGNIITIKGLSSGKTIVKVTDTTTNKTIPFGIEVKGPSANEKDAVDLGLSVKWAKMNVGAVSEEDCGEHYAWGETESKSYFSWSSYDFCNGTESTISKYNSHDGKTMLDPSDDAAHVIMGGNWRTPTLTEMEELVNRCKWTKETLNGVNGARVTGPNGNSIFLPFGGQMFDDQLSHYDNSGYYYASTLSDQGEKYAPVLCCFGNGNIHQFVNYARYYGLNIRGVLSK